MLEDRQASEGSEDVRELRRMLAIGDKEISAGDGHALESVLNDADALLREAES